MYMVVSFRFLIFVKGIKYKIKKWIEF